MASRTHTADTLDAQVNKAERSTYTYNLLWAFPSTTYSGSSGVEWTPKQLPSSRPNAQITYHTPHNPCCFWREAHPKTQPVETPVRACADRVPGNRFKMHLHFNYMRRYVKYIWQTEFAHKLNFALLFCCFRQPRQQRGELRALFHGTEVNKNNNNNINQQLQHRHNDFVTPSKVVASQHWPGVTFVFAGSSNGRSFLGWEQHSSDEKDAANGCQSRGRTNSVPKNGYLGRLFAVEQRAKNFRNSGDTKVRNRFGSKMLCTSYPVNPVTRFLRNHPYGYKALARTCTYLLQCKFYARLFI